VDSAPHDPVDLLHENLEVVLGLGLNRNGTLNTYFITCCQVARSIGKIRSSPLWIREDCLDALRKQRDER